MSEIGILIIAFVAISSIGITVRRLKINHQVYNRTRYVKGYAMDTFKEYAIKHSYDLRANKLLHDRLPKIQKLNKNSSEYANAVGNLLHDILSPYTHLMTKDELRAYRNRNQSEMKRMISECLNPSPRFDGIYL